MFADPKFCFPVGARHVLGQWYGTKLAIGCRIDLDRQCSPYLVCHLASLSPQAKVSYWHLADMKTVFENVCFEHKADAVMQTSTSANDPKPAGCPCRIQ